MHKGARQFYLFFFLVKLETNCHALNLLVCKTGHFDIVINFDFHMQSLNKYRCCVYLFFSDETERNLSTAFHS